MCIPTQSLKGDYPYTFDLFAKNGTLDGTRTRSTCDLNTVCLPIPPPGHVFGGQ